jgi:hypothetical protein
VEEESSFDAGVTALRHELAVSSHGLTSIGRVEEHAFRARCDGDGVLSFSGGNAVASSQKTVMNKDFDAVEATRTTDLGRGRGGKALRPNKIFRAG